MNQTLVWLLIIAFAVSSCDKKSDTESSNKSTTTTTAAAGTATAASGTTQGSLATVSTAPLLVESTDVVTVASSTMQAVLEATGTLKAVRQVVVKTKTVGDVVELSLLEGQPVKRGQVVARIDEIESGMRLRDRQAQTQSAKAQLELANRTFENQQQLFQKGFISQAALDTAQTQLNVAKAGVDSNNAALAIAKKSVADSRLVSPINGIVAERYVQLNEKVGLDARVMLIVDDTSLELEALLPVADTAKLVAGGSVTVKPEGLPAPISGKITRINPTTASGTRLVPVHIEISNAGGKLKQGQFATVNIVTSKKDNIISISPDSVREAAGRSFVYTVGSDNKISEQDVQLGERGSSSDGRDVVQVLKGVGAGTRIVATNLGPLRIGTTVQLRTAPKN